MPLTQGSDEGQCSLNRSSPEVVYDAAVRVPFTDLRRRCEVMFIAGRVAGLFTVVAAMVFTLVGLRLAAWCEIDLKKAATQWSGGSGSPVEREIRLPLSPYLTLPG